MAYRVEILTKDLVPITEVKDLAPLTNGNVLEYTNRLSNSGMCKFRVGTKDPLLTLHGNILKPYANHVRVWRGRSVVWQGVIINSPHRTPSYIEIEAHTYLYLLDKALVKHDAADGSGADNFRTFKAGTMDAAITAVLNETKTNIGGSNVLTNLAIGTVENPVFPAGYTKLDGTSLAGQAWTFSDEFQLKFDFRTVLYMLQSFGAYSVADFEIAATTNPTTGATTLTFNFKKYIGNKQPQLTFAYGGTGAIEHYDVPYDGKGMANEILGVAADTSFNILKETQTDTASVALYGKIQTVAAFADAKNLNVLRSRMKEDLVFSALPDDEIHVTLNERAYPLGQYGLGDSVTLDIRDHVIQVNAIRRITGIDVAVHNTGRETIVLLTNIPRDTQ